MARGFDSVLLDSSGWQSLLNSGRNYLLNGDFTSAISSFSSLLTKVSGSFSLKFALVEAYIGKGVGLMGLAQYNEAVDNFSNALALSSEANCSRRVEILWRRGQAYQKSGLVTRAIADYSSALSENPKFSDAFLSRGVLLFSLSQYIQAYSDFSFAIQADSRSSEAYKWRAQCCLLLQAPPSYSDCKSALHDCSLALSISPNDSRCLLIRARAFLGLHQYSLAKEAYLAAVSVDSSVVDEDFLRAVSRGIKRNPETELVHEDKRICSGSLCQNTAF